LTFSRQEATKLYKRELNPRIKERLLLLILRVKDDFVYFQLMQQMNFIGVDLGPCTGLIGSLKKVSRVLRTDPRLVDLQKSLKK
jgi:hypothetical protein